MSIIFLILALLIGIVLGLFGAGGGMLTVPALMLAGDLSIKQAVPMSLWIVALVSLTAAMHQKAWRGIHWKLLATLAVSGVAGSSAGAMVGSVIPDRIQLGMLSLMILFVAAWIGLIRLENKVAIFRFIPAAVAGLMIGLLTGILGVGGGFLLVPVLIYLGIGHFPTAVGHSLLLIFINAVSGSLSYLISRPVDIDPLLTAAITFVAATGSLLGGYLLARLPSEWLQKGFAAMLVLLGLFVGWQALSA